MRKFHPREKITIEKSLSNFEMDLLKTLENQNISDEQKAKVVIEISESFDTIIGNPALVEFYLNVFINYLSTSPCQFSSENPSQKVISEFL